MSLILFGFPLRRIPRAPVSACPVNLNVARVLIVEEQKELRVRHEHIRLWVGTVKIQGPLLFADVMFDRLERVVAANFVKLHEAESRLDDLTLLDRGCAAQAL